MRRELALPPTGASASRCHGDEPQPPRESSACLQEAGPPIQPRPRPQPVSPPSGFCSLAPAFAARALTRSWEEQLPHATNSIKLPVIPKPGASSLCAATLPPARLRFGGEEEAGSRDAKLWGRWSRDRRWGRVKGDNVEVRTVLKCLAFRKRPVLQQSS